LASPVFHRHTYRLRCVSLRVSFCV
jgi:hypothetical protein